MLLCLQPSVALSKDTSTYHTIVRCQLTPEGDKDCIEERAGVVKQVADASVETDVGQIPVLAADRLVTEWTHLELLATATRLSAVGSKLSSDCDHASSVNMFKNRIDTNLVISQDEEYIYL